MKESVHIKNLGPIKDVYIEDIKKLTVFIGESGSGKSTIMKTIALFRWIYKMHNIRSYLKHSNVSKSPFTFNMKEYFANCGFDKYINKDTEIIYSTDFELDQRYEIKYSSKGLKGVDQHSLINVNDLYYNKLSFISESRNVIPLWADKGSTLPGANLGFYFHEVYNDFDLASNSVKDLDLKYLKLKLSVKKESKSKKYFIKGQEYELELKNSSSGTQSAVPITLIAEHFSKYYNFDKALNETILKYLTQIDKLTEFKAVQNLGDIRKKLFIHIEEPEISLYPDAQCHLIADLINKCFINNKNDVNLMFSTHSPYIINYLNLLIKANDANKLVDDANMNFDDIAVYNVEDGKVESLKAKNQRLVNTNILSDTINHIYERYKQL